MKHLLFLLLISLSAMAGPLPEPIVPEAPMTTGHLCSKDNQDFHEHRYRERIPYCRRNVASSIKRQIYANYGIPPKCQREYTIDHFFPLSLGGSNQVTNLWPEHKAVKESRLNLEAQLFEQLKSGEIPQARALALIEEAKLRPDTSKIPKGNYCEQLRPQRR